MEKIEVIWEIHVRYRKEKCWNYKKKFGQTRQAFETVDQDILEQIRVIECQVEGEIWHNTWRHNQVSMMASFCEIYEIVQLWDQRKAFWEVSMIISFCEIYEIV